MKIISWNVNSIRARINHVNELLQTEKPDFLCLQETKIIDNEFPIKSFTELGYFSYFFGIPSYNGVAILSKKKSINTGKIESSSNQKVQNATEQSNGSEESYKEHSSEEDSSDGEFCVYYTIDDNKKGDHYYDSDPRKHIDPKRKLQRK